MSSTGTKSIRMDTEEADEVIEEKEEQGEEEEEEEGEGEEEHGVSPFFMVLW